MVGMDQATSAAALYHCAIRRWTLIWGDPLLTGSVSMLLYGVAGLLLLWVARRTGAGDRRLWQVCAILFFLQVVNTHLDLHAVPAAIGHCVSQAQGWYENRGQVKLLGLVLIGILGAVVLIAAAIGSWRSIRGNALLVLGVTVAIGMTLVKGAGLDAAEKMYHVQLGPFRWADLIEYSGIAIAGLAAVLRLRRMRHERPRRRRPQLRGVRGDAADW
jgi:hypothetical protein